MADKLSKELERWRRDQEKLAAQQAAAAKKPKPKKELPKPAAEVKPVVQAVRRGPPLPQIIKKALETLQREARPLSSTELAEAAGTGFKSWFHERDTELWESLRNNEKIKYEGDRYAYKAKFVAKDKAELLALLTKRPEGTSMRELNDAYPGDVGGERLTADIAAMQQEGAVWVIINSESKEGVVYPRDKSYELPVDDRIKRMWASMEVPTDPGALSRELQRAGIPVSARQSVIPPRSLPPSKEERRKKRKRDFSKLHVTNVHLWDELFANKDLPSADALD